MNTNTEIINGRYLLQSTIGSGGMGIVYRATDRLTSDTVALKRVNLSNKLHIGDSLATSTTEDDLRLALAREFQLLAGLRHPHIISVLDYGFDEERQPFFTMTYLSDSQNILDAAHDLSIERKIELIQQLLQALAYLHRRGILHRDLKPDNVLVCDGVVRVLDFGLSASDKISGSDSSGTPLYMAPELFEEHRYSPEADLYAVGILLYQLLTDQHPFAPFDFTFLDRVLDEMPDFTQVDDPRLQPIFVQLLAKRPHQRFTTALETLRTLMNALEKPLPPETTAIRESYLQAATFVGREAELNRLTTALANVTEGQSAVWLIGGESGVGKSRLLDEVRVMAMVNGWQVLSGQEVEENRLPYQLWREIVARLVLNTALSDLEASILKELVPEIDRLLGRTVPLLPPSKGVEAQERLSMTLVELLKRQRQTTLLLLEDLHWVGDSLPLVVRILERLDELPGLMVLGSYRRDERPGLPKELPNTQVMMLERLSAREVQQLSQAMLGNTVSSTEIVSLLTTETEGNTFFIVEVMRALAEEAGRIDKIDQTNLTTGILTDGMETLLQRRIQRVLATDQPLLKRAAVAGRQLDLAILAVLAQDRDIEGWLQRVSETTILQVMDNQWSFSHDKLREAIISALSPVDRQQAHRQVAEAIEQVYAEDQRYHQALLEHWHQVGDQDKEIFYLDSAAEYLVKTRVDYAQAIRLLERGLKTLTENDTRRVSLLNWQAKATLELHGEQNIAQAAALARQAKILAERVGDQTGLIKSLDHLADSLMLLDYHDSRVEQYLQKALNIAHSIDDQLAIANIFSQLGLMAYRQGELNKAINFYEEGIKVWECTDDHVGLADTRGLFALVLLVMGKYEQAGIHYQQSIEIYREKGLELPMAWQLLNLGRVPFALGDYEQASNYFNQSLTLFQKFGNYAGASYCLVNLGRLSIVQKNYDQALAHLSEGLTLAKKIEDRAGIGFLLDNLGWLAFLQEEYEQAEQHLRQGLEVLQALGHTCAQANLLSHLGIVHLKLNNPDQAQAFFHEALTIAQDNQMEPVAIDTVLGFAWLKLLQGELLLAGELVGLAQHHPSFNNEMQSWFDMVQSKVAIALSPADLERSLQSGKRLNLAQVVEDFIR